MAKEPSVLVSQFIKCGICEIHFIPFGGRIPVVHYNRNTEFRRRLHNSGVSCRDDEQ